MLPISSDAQYVLSTLRNAGFEAYCVGGAVRDLLMKVTPSDYDVTTNAAPDNITQLFEKTFATGLKHGTVTVLAENSTVEVTTYRSEGAYTDGRHPESVEFVSRLEEDLKRRDFTVNAIAYSPADGVIDPMGGIKDIENRIIRCVGEAEKRFLEDRLRIMRCFRFAVKLGFDIEKDTLTAALKLLPQLNTISRERIYSELCQMLCGKDICKAKPFFASGELYFLGLNAPDSRFEKLGSIAPEPAARLAAYCIISGSDPSTVSAALKAPNEFKRRVKSIYKTAKTEFDTVYDVRKALITVGEDLLERVIEIKEKVLSQDTECIRRFFSAALSEKLPKTFAELDISGKDIMALGINGKDIGTVIGRLYDAVLREPTQNEFDILIDLARNLKN